ncbi:MAG: hypothetical protein KAH48_11505, partial [Chlorobi bacterium]|nr:hypothetical protein [Chlorobiota bacterium]
ETFPLFKDLYYAADGGSPLIHETLGMSRELFVGLFAIVAIGLFIVVGKIEKKPSAAIEPVAKNYGRAKAAIVVATLLAIITILLPDEELYSEKLADTKIESTEEFEAYFVDPIDVAFDNFNKLDKYFLIDVRDTNSYKEYCITNASNFPVEKFDDRFMSESFETNKQIVLYANDTETALKMKVLLADEGIKDLYILRGGLDEFKRIIYNTEKTTGSIDKISNDSYDFIVKYRDYLNSDSKLTKPILKKKKVIKVIKVEGGC